MAREQRPDLLNLFLPRLHAIVSPIAFPAGASFEQLPRPIAHERLLQHSQQLLIEPLHTLIGGLIGSAAEMRRDALLAPFELTLVKEA